MNYLKLSICITVFTLSATFNLIADETRISEIERKVDALVNDFEKFTFKDVFVPVGEQKHGMGPAASKIYFKEEGISIGGYGEMTYQNYEEGASDNIDFLRGVIYFGYKFNENWLINMELEFEHASTDKSGSSSVEFAYLDYLHSELLNFRAGLVLVPMGLVNELHEPTVFNSVNRPLTEGRIIPSTWRENGAGVFGQNEYIQYKVFIVNGFDATGFSPSGLRGGRQKGSSAKAEDFALVGRLDFTRKENITLGISAYSGNSGHGLDYNGETLDINTSLVDFHFNCDFEYIYARGLFVSAELDDIGELNRFKNPMIADELIESIGEEMEGWYLEFGLDIFKCLDISDKSLMFYVRQEEINTQKSVADGFMSSQRNDIENLTLGLAFKPIKNISIKADYQWVEDAAGIEKNQANLGMGYVF